MQHFGHDKTTHCTPVSAPSALLSRDRLIRRWQHGSDSFFWRAEADGLLLPVRRPGCRSVAYLWSAVFEFEGGLPPEGWDAVYRADLLRPEEVAPLVARRRHWVLAAARSGELPCRRIGSQVRFVPAEIARWQAGWT